jgi:hypothetical protein
LGVSGGSFPGGALADKDGRFRIDGLIPGLKYQMRISHDFAGLTIASGKTKDLTVRPGQTMDLGEIQMK